MMIKVLVFWMLIVTSQFSFADPPKVTKKIPPEFPEEALRKKVTEGVVKAKLSIDANGNVTNVEIVEATPPKAKVFNESAIEALMKWKFEAPGKPETAEVKLVFSEE